MPEPKIRLQKSFPSVLVIDDARIDVRVKRMTNREFDEFAIMFARLAGQKVDLKPDWIQTAEEKAAAEDENRTWIRASLDQYFEILPGQIDDAGHDVTKGGELLDLFGGRFDVAPQALSLILGENSVPEKKKEKYRLQLVSSLGLVQDAALGGNGSLPAPTADAAEPLISVSLAAATAPSNGASSGTAAPSA